MRIGGLAFGAVAVVTFGAVGAVVSSAVASTVSVHCTSQSPAPLQDAINAAPAGSTVKVSGTCHGNFTVAKSITIEGSSKATLTGDADGSRTLTITGKPLVRLEALTVSSGQANRGGGIASMTGASLTLDRVTMNGNSASSTTRASGGAIYMSNGGKLTVVDSTFTNNTATTSGTAGAQTADGGAIWFSATATITGSTFSNNLAATTSTAADGGAEAYGGAIRSSGKLTIASTTFSDNSALARADNTSGNLQGEGGALYAIGKTRSITIAHSTFTGNKASGTAIDAASALGGAASFGPDVACVLTISDSRFDKNSATASSSTAAATGLGGGLYADVTTIRIAHTTIRGSSATATSDVNGGVSAGGAFIAGNGSLVDSRVIGNTASENSPNGRSTATGGGLAIEVDSGRFAVTRSTIDRNHVRATSSDGGYDVDGGGIDVSDDVQVAVSSSTISNNTASATVGTNPSAVRGGGLAFSDDTAGDTVTNSTIAGNSATVSKALGPTTVYGGGIYAIKAQLRYATVADNAVSASGSGTPLTATGGGLYAESAITATGSIVAGNHSAGASANCNAVRSRGYNLLGSLIGCHAALRSTDNSHGAPKLAALAANGGPTKTMALRNGSAALNRVPKTRCRSVVGRDQRGVKRPQGARCDEGAYEKKA
jgi:hypothetical protein